MDRITTILFDFDGVVADTEHLYSVFWSGVAEKFCLDTPDFTARIKGSTMTTIFDNYFPLLSEEGRQGIIRDCMAFELAMEYREVAGAFDFIQLLKQKNYKVGLVTSSPDSKMSIALRHLHLEDVFDTIVTANRIRRGKPDPMCYLVAAEDLRVTPRECVVFEDSFPGIEAGKGAGMKVIALSTTNTFTSLSGKVHAVIPDFTDQDKIFSYFVN